MSALPHLPCPPSRFTMENHNEAPLLDPFTTELEGLKFVVAEARSMSVGGLDIAGRGDCACLFLYAPHYEVATGARLAMVIRLASENAHAIAKALIDVQDRIDAAANDAAASHLQDIASGVAKGLSPEGKAKVDAAWPNLPPEEREQLVTRYTVQRDTRSGWDMFRDLIGLRPGQYHKAAAKALVALGIYAVILFWWVALTPATSMGGLPG